MKVLEFHGSKDEDCIRLTFEGAFDPQAAWESELEPFFQALEKYAGGWMPDVVGRQAAAQIHPPRHLEGAGGGASRKGNHHLALPHEVARVGYGRLWFPLPRARTWTSRSR